LSVGKSEVEADPWQHDRLWDVAESLTTDS